MARPAPARSVSQHLYATRPLRQFPTMSRLTVTKRPPGLTASTDARAVSGLTRRPSADRRLGVSRRGRAQSVGDTVFLQRPAAVQAAAGHQIVSYDWELRATATTARGAQVSPRPSSQQASYQVVLTVTDDAGQRSTPNTLGPLSMPGNPVCLLHIVGPKAPRRHTMFFDGGGSTAVEWLQPSCPTSGAFGDGFHRVGTKRLTA